MAQPRTAGEPRNVKLVFLRGPDGRRMHLAEGEYEDLHCWQEFCPDTDEAWTEGMLIRVGNGYYIGNRARCLDDYVDGSHQSAYSPDSPESWDTLELTSPEKAADILLAGGIHVPDDLFVLAYGVPLVAYVPKEGRCPSAITDDQPPGPDEWDSPPPTESRPCPLTLGRDEETYWVRVPNGDRINLGDKEYYSLLALKDAYPGRIGGKRLIDAAVRVADPPKHIKAAAARSQHLAQYLKCPGPRVGTRCVTGYCIAWPSDA